MVKIRNYTQASSGNELNGKIIDCKCLALLSARQKCSWMAILFFVP